MAADTATTPTALDEAIVLDATVLFLDALAELPAFADKRDGLEDLVAAVGRARDRLVDAEDLDDSDVDRYANVWVDSRGLFDGRNPERFLIDPGSSRDVELLTEQLHKLAENVIGVGWNHRARKWGRDA